MNKNIRSEDYLNSWLKANELIQSEQITSSGLIERTIHYQQKTIHYKSKELIYTNTITDILLVFKDKKTWTKRKTSSQIRNWLNINLSGIAFTTELNDWLKQGMLIQLNEYEDRGLTLAGTYYIPGLNLQAFWDDQSNQKDQEENEFYETIKEETRKLENPYLHSGFAALQQWLIREADNLLRKKVDFFLSVLITASKTPFFDWKEIGTHSLFKDNASAPSKLFDGSKDAYLEELEEIIGDPAETIHLTTKPGNHDIVLAARCGFHFSFGTFDYESAPVLTKLTGEEIAFLQTIDRKTVNTLFLAENRAVVRKLIRHFPEESRSGIAIVGFDGQVRSAIYDLLSCFRESGVQRVVVWSDYDKAAVSMVEKLFTLGFERFEFIAQDYGTLSRVSYEEGLKRLKDLESGSLTEQEYFLWDIDQLKSLIVEGDDRC